MFARQAFRPARTLGAHIRRYATEAPPKSSPPPSPSSSAASSSSSNTSSSGGGSSILPWTLGGLIIGGGAGYWYYASSGSSSSSDQKAAAGPAKKTFTGGEQGFVSLKLAEVETINHNTKKFRFSLPEEDAVTGLNIASALLTKLHPENKDKPVIRPYTPTSDEDTRGYLDLIVKAYPGGPMSQHMHSMEPGQTLDFKGPIPKYPWSENKHEHIALIAGGTGITPMYQLTRAIFSNPADRTKVTLIFGNVTEEDILLREQFEELENTYPQRFSVHYLLDKPPADWKRGSKGFITKELLKTVLPEPKEGDKLKIFVCGPPAMYKAISGSKKSPADQGELAGLLQELGYSKEQVYKF